MSALTWPGTAAASVKAATPTLYTNEGRLRQLILEHGRGSSASIKASAPALCTNEGRFGHLILEHGSGSSQSCNQDYIQEQVCMGRIAAQKRHCLQQGLADKQ